MSEPRGRQVLGTGGYLRLVVDRGWEYAERTRGLEAVAVIAVTTSDELILTEQFRIPIGRKVIDLPAGLVGDEGEEDLVPAARRELEEETGYRARTLRRVFTGPTSAGLSNELVNFLLASGVRKVSGGGGIAGENITVHLVPVDGALRWLERYGRRRGTVSPNVYAALAILMQQRRR